MFSETHPFICSLQLIDPAWVPEFHFSKNAIFFLLLVCIFRKAERARQQPSTSKPLAWFLRGVEWSVHLLNCSQIAKAVTLPELRSFPEASDTEQPWWILVSHQGRKPEFHGSRRYGHYRHIHYSNYSNGNQLVMKMHLPRGVMTRFNGFPSLNRVGVEKCETSSCKQGAQDLRTALEDETRIRLELELNRSLLRGRVCVTYEERGLRNT